MREYQVRICERLGVKFPGPTRQKPKSVRLNGMSFVPSGVDVRCPAGMTKPPRALEFLLRSYAAEPARAAQQGYQRDEEPSSITAQAERAVVQIRHR